MHKAVLAFVLCSCSAAWAQDAVQVDAKHFKVEYEDNKIRVVREVLSPGESTPQHSHPERVVVVVGGASLRIVDVSGQVDTIEVKVGDAEHLDGQTHTVTNVGNTVFEEVSTEFKVPIGKQPASAEVPRRPSVEPESNPKFPEPEASKRAPSAAREAAPTTSATQVTPARTPEPSKPTVASQLETRVEVASPIQGGKTVKVNGQDLTYIEAGDGDPLILVHGTGNDLRDWSKQIDEFARRYRVIAYSRRCHYPNTCTGTEKDYLYDVHARDLIALMDALNIRKARVVGHSYGASIVGLAAAIAPERFSAVVLAEPGFRDLLPELQADRQQYAVEEIMKMIRKMFLKQHNLEGAVHAYADWIKTGLWDEMDSTAKQRMLDNGKALIAQAANPSAPVFDCDSAKKITIPMLVVSGEQSAPNNRIISSTLAECTGAKRTIIPAAAHTMHRQAPDVFNRAVLDFFAPLQ